MTDPVRCGLCTAICTSTGVGKWVCSNGHRLTVTVLTPRYMRVQVDPVAFDSFYDALEANPDRDMETYVDRGMDCVDGSGAEIVRALLTAGWRPPSEQVVEALRAVLGGPPMRVLRSRPFNPEEQR